MYKQAYKIMRTTLDIPTELIEEAMAVTGAKTKSHWSKALAFFIW